LKTRIVTPVIYQGEVLGILIFYHNNVQKIWHPEEIGLVEGISAQLAAAISQATLFEKTERQNLELEKALDELKRAQLQLIQSEKMASLGKLVAGVAHEINTPVGSLSSNVDVLVKFTQKLKEKIEKNEDVNALFTVLDDINAVNTEAIKRINNIVKSLKNFARLDEAELKKVDVHDGIRSSIMLISHEIKDRIEIIEQYNEIPEIECYPNLLNQVIMNLLVNAYQSIEGKGSITVKTSVINNMLNIEILDTGKGIEEADLNKIFDPGYTTKGVGVGTGLGLSICYRIIKKHHGIIKVDSEVGKGTKFTVEIPLRQETKC
jgi:signal transduction histidine kinase